MDRYRLAHRWVLLYSTLLIDDVRRATLSDMRRAENVMLNV